MSKFVVVGAGPVGRETARLLAEDGHEVVMTSRSAGSLEAERVRTVSADASEPGALRHLVNDAEAIFMCAMAAYDRWPVDFFPILEETVQAAEGAGAKILIAGNTYAYGEQAPIPYTSTGSLNPTTRKGTVRGIMWERALRSSAPAIEVRAADYLGRDALTYVSLLVLPTLLEGRSVGFLGSFDTLHSWSYTNDVARTLVAASKYEGEWNRAFMAPVQNATVRDLIEQVAKLRGIEVPSLEILSEPELVSAGWHEAVEMTYQWARPSLIDASETEELLRVTASTLDEMILDTIKS